MKPVTAEEERSRQLLAASLELQQELLPLYAAAQVLDYVAEYIAEQTGDGTVDPNTPVFQHHPIARLLLNRAQGLTEDGKPYAGRYRYDVAFEVSGYYITGITFTFWHADRAHTIRLPVERHTNYVMLGRLLAASAKDAKRTADYYTLAIEALQVTRKEQTNGISA